MGYFINHDIRIPVKQPGFNSESKGPRFFLTLAHLGCGKDGWAPWQVDSLTIEKIGLFTCQRLLGGSSQFLDTSYVVNNLGLFLSPKDPVVGPLPNGRFMDYKWG